MYRLTNVGLSASFRAVDYEEPDFVDATFGSLYFVVTANRARSDLTFNIGYNGVRRDNGQKTSLDVTPDIPPLLAAAEISASITFILSPDLLSFKKSELYSFEKSFQYCF